MHLSHDALIDCYVENLNVLELKLASKMRSGLPAIALTTRQKESSLVTYPEPVCHKPTIPIIFLSEHRLQVLLGLGNAIESTFQKVEKMNPSVRGF